MSLYQLSMKPFSLLEDLVVRKMFLILFDLNNLDRNLFIRISGKQFLNTCEYLDVKNNEFTNFLKKDVNGNLKLVKENTLTNEDNDVKQMNENVDKMKIKDEEIKNDAKLKNGDRIDLKMASEFNNINKKSKEPLILEVEGEKMDEIN